MLRHQEGDIEWLEYELFADFKGIDHRVFLRHGGSSEGVYRSLNVGRSMGDSSARVSENLNKISMLLGCSEIVVAEQEHGKTICHITRGNKDQLFVGDVLTTQAEGLPLLIKHADCQASCFYDPVNQAMALVHCGWRGNVGGVYAETVVFMQRTYGTSPSNLFVCVSPSLGPEHSEFVNYRTELPECFWAFQYKPFYFDLWAISEWQLTHAGVLPQHIQMAKIDTWENPKDYFSYRRSHPTGCHGSVATLINARGGR